MKPEDSTTKAIIAFARDVRKLQHRAVQEYQPVVDAILRGGSRDAAHIARTLDGLLDFCGREPMLAIFKQLCRHYERRQWLSAGASAPPGAPSCPFG